MAMKGQAGCGYHRAGRGCSASALSARDVVALTRRDALAVLAGASAAALVGCQQVSGITAALVSPEEETKLGRTAFDQMKSETPVSRDRALQERLEAIGRRIVPTSGSRIPVDEWEFVVFDTEELNAFALPGGRVGFYKGILRLMDNDAQVAAVMGHEIAHVNARHGAQRIGAERMTGFGLEAVSATLEVGQVAYGGQVAAALGVGAQYGMLLPYSRSHELEADRLGLTYMAEAGYDPAEAIAFWQDFVRETSAGPELPAFFSTHPADETRITQFRELLPEAEETYRRSRSSVQS
jgi:predicted Zn-dependent protease